MTSTYQDWRLQRSPKPGITSAIPIIALFLGQAIRDWADGVAVVIAFGGCHLA